MLNVAHEKEHYLAAFARFEKTPAAGRDAGLRRLRQEALGRFEALGFPTSREEEWRWTNVAPIAKARFQPADGARNGLAAAKLQPFLLNGVEAARLVFVNGCFSVELSSRSALPKGVTAGSLEDALDAGVPAVRAHLGRLAGCEERAFVALNTAFLRDGAFVHVAQGVHVAQPIHLLFVTSPGAEARASFPRTLIVAEEGSQAVVVESYAGLEDGVYFTNAVTEIAVGPAASVEHYRVQRESVRAFHVAALQARLERESRFWSHHFAFGGALARNDVGVVFDAEGGEATLNGLYLVRGEQLIDNHTVIDHAKPRCSSHELYKGILDGKGRGVFNGKILVRPDAQKTDAKQTNKALLLSDDAQINTQPMLKIYADDVKCTHGATVGQLDKDALFFLRSRGIGLDHARGILTFAFANDLVGRVRCAGLKGSLDALLSAELRLPGEFTGGGRR